MKKLLRLFAILYIISALNTIIFANPVAQNVEITVEAAEIDGNIIPPQVTARTAALINAATGEVLYDKNMNEKMYPASITKVMTAILALENASLDEVVYFTEENVNSFDMYSSNIGMRRGETLTMDMALHAIMIASANEVSRGIAEHIAGTEAEFAVMMTEKAREIGALNTNFSNSHGLHDENNYTTAYDVALIFRYALGHPYFREIIEKLHYQIPPTGVLNEPRDLNLGNLMLHRGSGYYYAPCRGGKTGYTDQAGYSLVTYAAKGQKELIAVVLFGDVVGRYSDSAALYEYGFNYFEELVLFDKFTFKEHIPVVQTYRDEEVRLGSVVVVADGNIERTVRKDTANSPLEIRTNLPGKFIAPVEEGRVLGSLEVYFGDEKYGETNLVAFTGIREMTNSEIRAMKWADFWDGQKMLLPVYLTFVPIIIFLTWMIVSTVRRFRKNYKRKHVFGAGKKKYKNMK